jgi:HEAT repeat protein
MSTNEDIHTYLTELDNPDLKIRNQARQHLLSVGDKAVPDLIHQLKTDRERCRWEATKLLGEIHDEMAITALVEALMDDSINVHWAATESLIKFGRDAILPLLEGITRHFDSMRFRQGAYHVLHILEGYHHLDPEVQEVLDALRSIEPSASAPWAAERAIEKIMYQK